VPLRGLVGSGERNKAPATVRGLYISEGPRGEEILRALYGPASGGERNKAPATVRGLYMGKTEEVSACVAAPDFRGRFGFAPRSGKSARDGPRPLHGTSGLRQGGATPSPVGAFAAIFQ